MLLDMTVTALEARRQLLDALAEAVDEIAFVLAALGAAYEQLDERTADRLEQALFKPVQLAFGRGRRTHEQFAARHGMPGRPFEPASAGLPSTRVRGHVEAAVEAAAEADRALAGLQDSPMLVEVGDVELRAGLAEVRELLGGVRPQARELLRTLGR